MSELPTPAVVPAGHVVRIRLGGHTYTSPIYSPTVAKTTASDLARLIAQVSTGTGFVPFTEADGNVVNVKARSVSAVESGPPRPRRENRPTTVVHNHFHDSGSVSAADVVETEPEPEHTAGCSCGARGDLDFILEHICPLERS